MTEYVLGFLFDSCGNVLLIKKEQPEWQRDKYNGIGGHIEPGELPITAMFREFQEEASLELKEWRHFGTVTGKRYKIYLYTARAPWYVPIEESVKGENLAWKAVNHLPENIIPDLRWMIPFANERLNPYCEVKIDD